MTPEPGPRAPQAVAPPEPEALLTVQQASVRRGGRLLMRSVSFSVMPGELIVLKGANGSGKSSLLRALAGLLPLAGGELRGPAAPGGAACSDGEDLPWPDFTYLNHHNGLTPELTARENLVLAMRMGKGAAGDRIDDTAVEGALRRLGLANALHMPVRRLSQGQQRRAALARVALSRARLWLLDEPLNALDDQGEGLVGMLLSQHLSAGGAAVVATHQSLPVAAHRTLTLSMASSPSAAMPCVPSGLAA